MTSLFLLIQEFRITRIRCFCLQEVNVRTQARNESLQERVTSLQHDTLSLRQQLDDARLASAKGEGAEHLNTVLDKIRSDQEKVDTIDTKTADPVYTTSLNIVHSLFRRRRRWQNATQL